MTDFQAGMLLLGVISICLTVIICVAIWAATRG